MVCNVEGRIFLLSVFSFKIKYSICRMLLFKYQLCINEDFTSLRFSWFKKTLWICRNGEDVSPFDRLFFTFLWPSTLLFWLEQKRDTLNLQTTDQHKCISSTAPTIRCHKCRERVLAHKNSVLKSNLNYTIIIIASFTKHLFFLLDIMYA